MSQVFAKPHERCGAVPNADTIDELLQENNCLITLISDNFNKGRMQDTITLQKNLHRNLLYLTLLAYKSNDKQEDQASKSNETSRGSPGDDDVKSSDLESLKRENNQSMQQVQSPLITFLSNSDKKTPTQSQIVITRLNSNDS